MKRGRPLAIIDWDEVGRWCEADCKATDIADALGISEDTLYTRCRRDLKQDFSAFRQQKRAKGNNSLRLKQHELAMEGDKAMLIWQGKQRLGQVERQEITGRDGEPNTFTVQIVRDDAHGTPQGQTELQPSHDI